MCVQGIIFSLFPFFIICDGLFDFFWKRRTNRARTVRERDHSRGQNNQTFKLGDTGGVVRVNPCHGGWREDAVRGSSSGNERPPFRLPRPGSTEQPCSQAQSTQASVVSPAHTCPPPDISTSMEMRRGTHQGYNLVTYLKKTSKEIPLFYGGKKNLSLVCGRKIVPQPT